MHVISGVVVVGYPVPKLSLSGKVVKLCLTGVQLINLAAFLFRELQDDVPTVLGAKPDT